MPESKRNTLTTTARAAESVLMLTVAEALALGGLLGGICAANLKTHGFYTATWGGVRTLFLAYNPAEVLS